MCLSVGRTICLSVHLSASLIFSLCVCLSVDPSVGLSACPVCKSDFLSVYLPVCRSVRPPVRLLVFETASLISACLSVGPPVFLSASPIYSLYVGRSVRPPVCLPACLTVSKSDFLFVYMSSVDPSGRLSACLCESKSVHLPVCLSVGRSLHCQTVNTVT